MSTVLSDNVVGVLPDGAQVDVTTGADGNDLVVIKSAVTGADLIFTGTTAISGKGFVDGEISIDGKAGQTTVVPIESTVFKGTTITNDGASDLQINVSVPNDAGRAFKFKKSTVESLGNTDDGISFSASPDGKTQLRVVKNTLDLGDGDDTVTFGKGVKVIGKNVIKFGEGTGNDSVEIADLDDVKGTIVVRNFGKGDSIKVNGKSYNFKQAIKFANKNDGLTIRKD